MFSGGEFFFHAECHKLNMKRSFLQEIFVNVLIITTFMRLNEQDSSMKYQSIVLLF